MPAGNERCLTFRAQKKLRLICLFPSFRLKIAPSTYDGATTPGKTLGKTLRTRLQGCFPNFKAVCPVPGYFLFAHVLDLVKAP
jgi:hypothetical protein